MNPALAFNTVVSFTTNTSWQNYSGEATLGFVAQAVGLGTEAFLSAAVGLSVALALIRGLIRRQPIAWATSGSTSSARSPGSCCRSPWCPACCWPGWAWSRTCPTGTWSRGGGRQAGYPALDRGHHRGGVTPGRPAPAAAHSAMEGKATAFGVPGSALFGVAAISSADGAANASYDSFTPAAACCCRRCSSPSSRRCPWARWLRDCTELGA